MLIRYFLKPFFGVLLFCSSHTLVASSFDEFMETGSLKGQGIDGLRFDSYLDWIEKKHPNLKKEIDLSDNLLDAAGALGIKYLLEMNLPIETLNLENNKLNNQALHYIAKGLQKNKFLRELNLKKNPFSMSMEDFKRLIGGGAQKIKVEFTKPPQVNGSALFMPPEEKKEAPSQKKTIPLEELILSGNLKGQKVDALRFDECLEIIETKEIKLLKLDLSDNALDASAALGLRYLLQKDASLTDLNLEGNHLTDQALRCIVQGVQGNKTLTSLNLSRNPFGDQGVKALAKSLEVNPGSSLKRITLLENNITEEGAKAFKEQLPQIQIVWQEEKTASQTTGEMISVSPTEAPQEKKEKTGLWPLVGLDQHLEKALGLKKKLGSRTDLDFAGSDTTGQGLKHFPRSVRRKIEEVDFTNCASLEDQYLGELKRYSKLKRLKLDNCPKITAKGLEPLSSLKDLRINMGGEENLTLEEACRRLNQ